MGQPFDPLPLDTPTVIADNLDVQIIATRTVNGGTVQTVPKPGGPTDLRNQRDVRLGAMVATLNAWSATAAGTTATAGNVVAVTNGILANLSTLYARLADLLQAEGRG